MKDKKEKSKTEIATFAAGCFWGVQQMFDETPGVISTIVGYTGGHVSSPKYPLVCTGLTGHAEAIEITFDPKKTSYEKLLNVFWKIHNPTTLNQQGPDVGSQYRSAIFYHDEKQKKLAEKTKKELEKSGKWKDPIVTQIVEAKEFYPAEKYHQKYYKTHEVYCHVY